MTRKIILIDDLPPETIAMLQALYSRSAESAEVHIEKARKSSRSFMQNYYVGYGHKSIADCGSTTLFFEGASILAAKVIQNHPLYCGQETSTRYIDMANQPVVTPVGTEDIIDRWTEFYRTSEAPVLGHLRALYPRKNDDDPTVYDRAIHARSFDIRRGFLPAGITTQLSLHMNLRQMGDHTYGLSKHPLREVRDLVADARSKLNARYGSSGFRSGTAGVAGRAHSAEEQAERDVWEEAAQASNAYSYSTSLRTSEFSTSIHPSVLCEYAHILGSRPVGSVLPHHLTDLGQIHFNFMLDFGSFRDIQRHRNGVCRMPLLTTENGFESWYLDNLPVDVRKTAYELVAAQTDAIERLPLDPIEAQYCVAMGYKVPTHLTYGLPAALYVLELRTGKAAHPTLRARMQSLARHFCDAFPTVRTHFDDNPDDWSVRRGEQTITEKT